MQKCKKGNAFFTFFCTALLFNKVSIKNFKNLFKFTRLLVDLSKNDFEKIAVLCLNIETLLKDAKLSEGEDTRLCQSDVAFPFFRHVRCRLTQLPKQQGVLMAFDKNAAALKEACENSSHFLILKKAQLALIEKLSTPKSYSSAIKKP